MPAKATLQIYMKKHKREIIIFLGLLVFLLPFLVLGQVTIDNPIKHGTFSELVTAIIGFIRTIALVAAPIVFIIAGLMYYMAAGNPEQVKKATDLMKWAAIGLVIILIAEGISMVIRGVMGVDEEGKLTSSLFKIFFG